MFLKMLKSQGLWSKTKCKRKTSWPSPVARL